ncbi:N2227-like protein-domain-containing protein [Zychaea mexicana]|uniref:N2227-like protein-domain-containing protein n=1 Tax=Zychaea mexicana TaxID=64656 RepID=UPI0022FE2F92|nr:N2227-like protein-domain-containing protein [Zychaea mexicana]KAI9499624.1 N2227-like protein-domain-containing protein [Zychaea mexicana]
MATHGHTHDHAHDHHGHDHGEFIDPAEAERAHLRTVLTAFTYYKAHARNRNHRRRTNFLALPEHHKRLIPSSLEKIDQVDRCIEKNMIMLRDIVKCAGMFMGIDPRALVAEGSQIQSDKPPVTPMDMDKVRSTLKQFVRDWAEEGKAERDATYGPILEELESIYGSVDVKDRGNVRVLVPGAGLGRLAYDIANKGFSSQGNEFSFFMLVASNFVLNRISRPHEYEIHPFVHSFSNIRSSEQQLKPIRIPDIVPSQLPATADFSMAAGEFVEVYGGDEDGYGTWDVVVTCFFIDTATNIIAYLEVIHNILKEGGTWINIGPLLYHFEDIPGEGSIELSLEDVKRVSREIGFEFKNEKTVNTTYTSNPDGMLKYVYECAFWSATKKSNPTQQQ